MNTTDVNISRIIREQRIFFNSGRTKDIKFRIEQLKKIKLGIQKYQDKIKEALYLDLKKPYFETYYSEIITSINDVDYALKHIKKWTRPKKKSVPIHQFNSYASIHSEPLGVVLIIGPWNVPFALNLFPLVGAISAGNCAIVKPSEIAPKTSKLITDFISEYFEPSYITVIEGGIKTSQQLLAEKFDHIFFTGGTKVGKIIMESAAKQLTPVTLELGGKNPCVVDADTKIKTAAERIVWGKYLNAGQSCIAPDYLLVDCKIKKDLLNALKQCIENFYGYEPENSPDYGRIINAHHFERLKLLLEYGDIFTGGKIDKDNLFIAPTIINNVSVENPLMEEEIFGPILPVLEYKDLEEAIEIINSFPKPLVTYLFSIDNKKQRIMIQQTSSGGVCINDVVMQASVFELPFGGVGDSGIGCYHGKASFDTFSHRKSVLQKPFPFFDIKLLYPPYKNKISFVKRLLK